jgi:hypothetical protein
MFPSFEQSPRPGFPVKRSFATPLTAAVLLALTLVAAPPSASAAPITCEFGGIGAGDSESCLSVDEGQTRKIFFFGDYSFDLEFLGNIFESFLVTVTDIVDPDLTGRLDDFPGHECVPIDDLGCVEFHVDDDSQGSAWDGFFRITIGWLQPTDDAFPNEPGDRIRILHARGDDGAGLPGNSSGNGDGFDTDITLDDSYTDHPPCPPYCDDALFPGDPGISGRDDNFQSFIVVQRPAVPEPMTLWLLTTGAGGLFLRRRYRRR